MSALSAPIRFELPEPIRGLLNHVRSRIRRDAMLNGALLLVISATLVFWTTTSLEAGWFRLQRLELPVGLRTLLLAVLLPLGLLVVIRRIAGPAFRNLSDTDIAVLVERRFPQFQDRLITSVESQQGVVSDGPLTGPLLQRSLQAAAQLAGSVEPAGVFDTSARRQLALLAGIATLSLATSLILKPELLNRWWRAFALCQPSYRERETQLILRVIAAPGERRLEFSSEGDRLVCRHPRGADLELEIRTPAAPRPDGRPWVVPDGVRVDVVRQDGSLSRTWVKSSAGGSFRLVLTRLQEAVAIDILGGDFRSSRPHEIEIVSKPALDALRLDCRFPEYTGWNELRESELLVTGSEVELPIGTKFTLSAESGKPLQAVRIVSDRFELSGDQTGSVMTQPPGSGQSRQGPPVIAADGRTITAQLKLTAPEPEADSSGETTGALATTQDSSGPLPIPAGGTLRFFLHDTDNIQSVSPETLRVQGIADQPPVVVARMTGIGNAITRRARIPIAGRLKDDYGLMSAGFEFRVDDETGWRPRPLRNPPEAGRLDFELSRSVDEPFEVFEVQPLELSDGQTLTLSIIATDGNPNPGVTRGDPLPFRIVSNEELLSLLYTREIGLRARFEEIIAQLEAIRDDLTFHREVAGRADAAGSGADSSDLASLNTCATRSGNNLRRQANDLLAILEGFEEIVLQLQNNAIPPQSLAETMQQQIVDPLKAAGPQLATADRAVGAFRVAVQENQPSAALVADSARQVAEVVDSLRAVLENVRDMAEFHEALRDLKAILDEQEKLRDETRDVQKRELLDKLKVLE